MSGSLDERVRDAEKLAAKVGRLLTVADRRDFDRTVVNLFPALVRDRERLQRALERLTNYAAWVADGGMTLELDEAVRDARAALALSYGGEETRVSDPSDKMITCVNCGGKPIDDPDADRLDVLADALEAALARARDTDETLEHVRGNLEQARASLANLIGSVVLEQEYPGLGEHVVAARGWIYRGIASSGGQE